MMQRNGTFNPCFAGGFNGPYPSRFVAHYGGGSRPAQYGPCFGAPLPQPMFQPNSCCFVPASALRRPAPIQNPCNAAPGPIRYDPCFH